MRQQRTTRPVSESGGAFVKAAANAHAALFVTPAKGDRGDAEMRRAVNRNFIVDRYDAKEERLEE
ncbi:MAG TPA: hypothetical protein VGC09_06395 [Rhodopila sp.]